MSFYELSLVCNLVLPASWPITCLHRSGPGCSDRAQVRRSRIALSPVNGSILGFAEVGRQGSILRSGEAGLWSVRFRDGKEILASEFSDSSPRRRFQSAADSSDSTAKLTYASADLDAVVNVRPQGDGFELSAEVTPKEKTALEFALPARLRFSVDGLERLVCPADGNQSVGTALLSEFFRPQPEPTSCGVGSDRPEGLRDPFRRRSGNARRGGSRDWAAGDGRRPPVVGRRGGCAEKARATVNRAPQASQVDLVLVDSDHGPYLSASRLGGQGRLWRFGGMIGRAEEDLVMELYSAVANRLASQVHATRSASSRWGAGRPQEAG